MNSVDNQKIAADAPYVAQDSLTIARNAAWKKSEM